MSVTVEIRQKSIFRKPLTLEDVKKLILTQTTGSFH